MPPFSKHLSIVVEVSNAGSHKIRPFTFFGNDCTQAILGHHKLCPTTYTSSYIPAKYSSTFCVSIACFAILDISSVLL